MPVFDLAVAARNRRRTDRDAQFLGSFLVPRAQGLLANSSRVQYDRILQSWLQVMRSLYLFAATAGVASAFSFNPPSDSNAAVQSRRYVLTNLVTAGAACASAAVITVPTEPAVAGVGAPVPFDEARKVLFPGSLINSVAALRIESALKYKNISDSRRKQNLDDKKRAKYGPKNTLVVTCSCSDDTTPMADTLAGMLGKDLTNTGVDGVVSLDCGSGGMPSSNIMSDISSAAKKLSESAGGRDINVVLIYGSHVGISKEGKVGYVERRVDDEESVATSEYAKAGDDRAIADAAKQAFKAIKSKIQSQIGAGEGISEITVVGGVTLNRSKFGKEKGEDAFYPLYAKQFMSDGSSLDIFYGAFGDREVAHKDRE